MVASSTPECAVLGDVPLDVGNDDVTISTTTAALDSGPTLPAPIDKEPLTEPPSETPPKDKEPVTEVYYYQKLRESADRFAHQLSTSKYVDDVELTWRGFDDKKKELVITSAMRFITFDPEADFKRFDDLAMAAMTSVMLNIVRTIKKSTKKPVGNALLRRAVTFQAADGDNLNKCRQVRGKFDVIE